MKIQISQRENTVDAHSVVTLEREGFRIYVEQDQSGVSKILKAYAVASDSPGLNHHLEKNQIDRCWMFSCNMNSVARSHPFELLLLDYERAKSFDTPEAIAAHSRILATEAPVGVMSLLEEFPEITTALELGMNWFPGDEMYRGFHFFVSEIDGKPANQYSGDDLFMTIFLLVRKLEIPGVDSPLITFDIVQPHAFALKFA